MKVIDVDALNEKLERLAIQRIKGDDGYDVLTVSLADVLRMIDSLSTIELETTVADKMSRKLDALGLPVREYNCLRRYGIDTIAELYKVQQDGMLPKVRNLGRKSMETVEKALDEFIEVKQLPPIRPVNNSENPNSLDVVSRQAAKNAICNACGKIDCDEMDTCKKLDIPSARSKALEWQYHSYIPHNKYCPKCKKDSPYNKRWNFCPNCGAKMEVTNGN